MNQELGYFISICGLEYTFNVFLLKLISTMKDFIILFMVAFQDFQKNCGIKKENIVELEIDPEISVISNIIIKKVYYITVLIISFQTDRARQTVQTLIKLDQSLHCSAFK